MIFPVILEKGNLEKIPYILGNGTPPLPSQYFFPGNETFLYFRKNFQIPKNQNFVYFSRKSYEQIFLKSL